MNKREFIIASTALAGASFLGSDTIAARIGNDLIKDAGITFHWNHRNSRLYCEYSAPTKGWLAVGFNNKSNLVGTRFVMVVVANNSIHIEEHMAINTGHMNVENMGIKSVFGDVSGEVKQGKSTLIFSFPNNISDSHPLNLEPDSRVYLMLAWSTSADFKHHSTWRKHFDIKL